MRERRQGLYHHPCTANRPFYERWKAEGGAATSRVAKANLIPTATTIVSIVGRLESKAELLAKWDTDRGDPCRGVPNGRYVHKGVAAAYRPAIHAHEARYYRCWHDFDLGLLELLVSVSSQWSSGSSLRFVSLRSLRLNQPFSLGVVKSLAANSSRGQ